MQKDSVLIQSNQSSIKSINGKTLDFRQHNASYDGDTLSLDSNINGVISSSKIRNDTLMKILNQNNNKLNLETRLKRLTKKNNKNKKRKTNKKKRKFRKKNKRTNKKKRSRKK
tara:strand:+ start:968 stop:1306 length:339 start_codon:yes stop_codon:yes gene_type:complete